MQRRFLHCVVVFVAFAAILHLSSERQLRPSDHGLSYQEGDGGGKQMLSFFGASSPSSAQVQLPEARNVSDTRDEGGARDLGKDHVRVGLLVASAVCGLIGVVLLVVSGVVYIRRLKKQERLKDGRIASTSAPASVRRQQYGGSL